MNDAPRKHVHGSRERRPQLRYFVDFLSVSYFLLEYARTKSAEPALLKQKLCLLKLSRREPSRALRRHHAGDGREQNYPWVYC